MIRAFKGALYDRLTLSFERGPGERIRSQLLAAAEGRVLEIGAGTGANLRHYPDSIVGPVLTEPDDGMAVRLVERAATRKGAEVVAARAEDLPFADASFDTVVSTLVLCSVGDPVAALREIGRLLRPGGSFLFLEHVRSDDPSRARWQDRLERPWRAVAGGCHPNRPTRATIEAAGFEVEEIEKGEMPAFPRLVRPYIVGRARPNASATSS
jgi:SAM-dependent methyltransferase